MVLFNLPIAIIRFGKFLLLSSVLLISGCAGSGPCYGPAPVGDCSNYERSIGTLYLDSVINQTLPDTMKSTIEFKNNNGFVTVFNQLQNENFKYSRQDLLNKSIPVECGSYTCYDYFYNQYKTTTFKATNVPFNFFYFFENISTTNKYDYLKDSLLKGYSLASIYLNNIGFPLPFNRPINKNSCLLDSVQVNQRLYKNVYQIYLDSSTINYTIIKPIGIYYNQTKGLIGFYLTNGETWGLNE